MVVCSATLARLIACGAIARAAFAAGSPTFSNAPAAAGFIVLSHSKVPRRPRAAISSQEQEVRRARSRKAPPPCPEHRNYRHDCFVGCRRRGSAFSVARFRIALSLEADLPVQTAR